MDVANLQGFRLNIEVIPSLKFCTSSNQLISTLFVLLNLAILQQSWLKAQPHSFSQLCFHRLEQALRQKWKIKLPYLESLPFSTYGNKKNISSSEFLLCLSLDI